MKPLEETSEGEEKRLAKFGGGFCRSFVFALEGIWHVLRTQRNFRVQMGVGMGVAVGGVWCRLGVAEWVAVVLAMGLVLSLELTNTAVEALVDLVMPERHPLAKIAKDAGAGAVLVGAVAAAVVGVLVFWPHVLASTK